jgi:O-antigen/teichoic acid export membrane protein
MPLSDDNHQASSSKKDLARSVAVLASGSIISQAVLLLSSPLLTRLYTPDQFGLLAVYSAAITILSTFATLGYDSAIPLPRRDDVAANVLGLSLICVAVITLVSALSLGLAGDALSRLLKAPQLADVTWMIPIGVFGIGTLTALTQWNVRRRRFRNLAQIKVVQAVSQTSIQVMAAVTPFATFGLLVGNLIGQTAGIGSLIRKFQHTDRRSLRGFSWRQVAFLARYYWRFPALSIWGSLAYSANNHAPAFVMLSMFGLSTSGFYLLAQRVGMMPVALLSTALNQAIYRTLAMSKKKPGEVGRTVIEPIRTLMGLIIAPAILAAAIAPYMTSLIFGSDWEEAGHYLRWMAPWPAVTLIFGVMSPVPSVMGLQKMATFFQIMSLVLSLCAMVFFGNLWGAVAAIAGFSIVKALTIIVYRMNMLHILQAPTGGLALTMLAQTSFFGLMAWLAVHLLRNADIGETTRWSALAVLAIVAIGIYLVINLIHFRRDRLRRQGLSTI